MIVEPDVVHHPKFIKLKAIVGAVAMELLVRLWAHCQQNKRGPFWRDVGSDYVEIVCTGTNQQGRVFEALRDCQWLHEREDGIEVHDWDEHNASLVARWKRDEKPVQRPMQGSAQPSAQTPDRTGQDQTGPEGNATTTSSGRMTPTLVEAVAYFQKNGSGYTPDQVKAAFNSFEATKDSAGYWRFGKGEVTDWGAALSSRLALLSERKNPRPHADGGSNGAVPPPPSGQTHVDFKTL